PGSLVLVATPIGNLADLTPRAAAELEAADVVACEDTRRTGKLLELAGLEARGLLAVNDDNFVRRGPEILDRLAKGERVAVVTDAGTPGISDPGERLVRAAVDRGYPVEVVPGPSAVVAALVVSGLPTNRFVFEGFLPRKGAARRERLSSLASERRTIVLYEAPHRLERTLVDLASALGSSRRVALCRELTKLHEEVWRGSLADAVEQVRTVAPRGEYVVVVEGGAPPLVSDEQLVSALAGERSAGRSTRDAVTAVAERFSVPRRRVYELAIEQDPLP
ncbi:MAG: 16S rRNA (cytidine(1402)-2'-O)-methyltransferase, partial [Acidimicrobiales bacterium]|nr:16S rRNA (cytidine(1402)-2'-O)-methyltransferase [Acidimicrobiales bacterium]